MYLRFSLSYKFIINRVVFIYFFAYYEGSDDLLICLFLILRLCVFSLKHNKLVVFTGHGQRFDFLFSASRAKECLLSTCLHNSSAWPINSRAARVAKLLQTVFRQVGIIFDAGYWKFNENLHMLSVALRTSLSFSCVLLRIAHRNKLVSRRHLANHRFRIPCKKIYKYSRLLSKL